MSKQLLLKTPRVCLRCGDPLASNLKVMKLKEKETITVVYVLCAKHSQAGNAEIQKGMRDHKERFVRTPIKNLSRNVINVKKGAIEIWG